MAQLITSVESVSFTFFFWHIQKLRQGVYLKTFSITVYGKFQLQRSCTFLAFFGLVCKLLKSLFSHLLLVSKLRELSLWFQRCPEALALVYIWDLLVLVLVFMESLICTVCTYSEFFWSVNCTVLVCKLCFLFQTILNLCPMLIIGGF